MSKNVFYKQKYKDLKNKLKLLIYENETYQEQLKKAQLEFVEVIKDRDFLLDRLLAYENVTSSTSESDATDFSDSDNNEKANSSSDNSSTSKKKKLNKLTSNEIKKKINNNSKYPKKIKNLSDQDQSSSPEEKNLDIANDSINPFLIFNDQFHNHNDKSIIISNNQQKSSLDQDKNFDNNQKLIFDKKIDDNLLPNLTSSELDSIELNLNNIDTDENLSNQLFASFDLPSNNQKEINFESQEKSLSLSQNIFNEV